MLSLLLSLVQEKNLERSALQLIAGLEKLFPENRFAFIRSGEPEPISGFPIKTPGCREDLFVKLIGAAQVMDPNHTFNIGKRNYLAVKKVLWANRLFPVSEEVGGNFSRSVTITMENSDVLIQTPGYEDRVI